MSARTSRPLGRARQAWRSFQQLWQSSRPTPDRRLKTSLFIEQLETREVPATLSGTVFLAINVANPGNTSPNPGPSIAGAVVTLDNGAQQQTTLANGNFSFTGVSTGSHTVTVTPPDGYWGFSAQSLSYNIVVQNAISTFDFLNFGLTPKNTALAQNFFETILSRPADQATLTTVLNSLNGGASIGSVLKTDFFKSDEYKTDVLPLARIIQGFFPKQPLDFDLLRNNVELFRLGVTQDALALNILYSSGVVAQFGDTSQLSNTDFVKFAAKNLLGTPLSANKLNFYVTQLTAEFINRGTVLLDLVNSDAFTENRPNIGRKIAVSLLYPALLGQQATQQQWTNGVNQLVGGLTTAQLANKITQKAAFKALTGLTDTLILDVNANQPTAEIDLLSRFQKYNPQTGLFDIAVTAGSLGSVAATPTNLYVIAHGWAPGFTEDVLLHSTPGDPLKAWETVQFPGGIPPSSDPAWLYAGVDQVSVTGLAQAIATFDPNAQIVLYSWIDESATPEPGGGLSIDNLLPLLYAGQSEAHTQMNGLRLAQGVEVALNANFFPQDGLIHILGHSHGSKVATVGALTLQQAGVPVTQLTIFESPEGGPVPLVKVDGFDVQLPPLQLPGLGGATNFNWYYLQQMALTRAPVTGRTPDLVNGLYPTFVDNYFSQDGFGSPYGGYPGLGDVVDVLLHPEVLYPLPTTLDSSAEAQLEATLFGSHDYPPAWYAQGSLMNVSPTGVGLNWSPLIDPTNAASLNSQYEQSWTSNVFSEQFDLGPPIARTPPNLEFGTHTPTFEPLSWAQAYEVGNTTDTGSSITLSVDAANATALDVITFAPLANAAIDGTNGNGMDFEVQFSGVAPGEIVQLVIYIHGQVFVSVPPASVNLGTLGYESVPLFTLDGSVAGSGVQKATISLDGFLGANVQPLIFGPFSGSQIPQLGFALVGANGSSASVTISNLQQFNNGINPPSPP